MRCLSCVLCIDACDTIMKSPDCGESLVRHTPKEQAAGASSRIWKPKTLAYGLALVAATAALGWSVRHQALLEMSVVRVRQFLFVRLSDGRIQNSYALHLENKTYEPVTLATMMRGLAGAELDLGKLAALALRTRCEGFTQLLLQRSVAAATGRG